MQAHWEARSQSIGLQIRVCTLHQYHPSTIHRDNQAHRPHLHMNIYARTFMFVYVHMQTHVDLPCMDGCESNWFPDCKLDLLEGHMQVPTSSFTISFSHFTKERSLTYHPGSSYSIELPRDNSKYSGPHSILSMKVYKFAIELHAFPCTHFC